jgi:hypothetical protein
MVGFLSVVGLFSGAFFFASRDVIATTVFHNFLGTFGVVKALAASGSVERMAAPQWPLIGTAAITLAVLLVGGVWLRHRHQGRMAASIPGPDAGQLRA